MCHRKNDQEITFEHPTYHWDYTVTERSRHIYRCFSDWIVFLQSLSICKDELFDLLHHNKGNQEWWVWHCLKKPNQTTKNPNKTQETNQTQPNQPNTTKPQSTHLPKPNQTTTKKPKLFCSVWSGLYLFWEFGWSIKSSKWKFTFSQLPCQCVYRWN